MNKILTIILGLILIAIVFGIYKLDSVHKLIVNANNEKSLEFKRDNDCASLGIAYIDQIENEANISKSGERFVGKYYWYSSFRNKCLIEYHSFVSNQDDTDFYSYCIDLTKGGTLAYHWSKTDKVTKISKDLDGTTDSFEKECR